MNGRSLRLFTLLICLTIAAVGSGLGSVPGEAAKHRQHRAKRAGSVGSEVFHGRVVPFGKYPFMAAVGLSDGAGGFKKKFCGGSLIGPSTVLTAGHCAAGAPPGRLAVVVGATEMTPTQGQVRTVISATAHPNYSGRSLRFDLAILKLDRPITGITPVTLIGAYDRSLDSAGSALTVIGWGNTTGTARKGARLHYPRTLREGNVSVIANRRCAKRWRLVGLKHGIPGPTDICTTGNRFGPGDSGGPIFSFQRGAPVQVSLVSAGLASGVKAPITPDLSTRLSEPSIAAFIASLNS